MGEEKEGGMASHHLTDIGFYPWSAGIITSYPGHLLGVDFALMVPRRKLRATEWRIR